MSAPISVVIPTLDAATQLPRAMEALFEGLQAGLIRELMTASRAWSARSTASICRAGRVSSRWSVASMMGLGIA